MNLINLCVQDLDAGQYRINVSVTDGKFVSHGMVDLNIQGIDYDMASNAVVVQLQAITPAEFYKAHKKQFIQVGRI